MAMLEVRERTITAEEFYDGWAGKDGRIELVDGRVIVMSPVAPTHGRVDGNLSSILVPFVKEHRLGEVYINTGFILRRNPDHVRGPDQTFVSAARIAANPPPERGFWEIAPDLVVEIVSPDDSAEDLLEKVGDYLGAGVKLIWIIYPRQRHVYVYRPDAPLAIVSGGASLDGGEVLPGFLLPLDRLWE